MFLRNFNSLNKIKMKKEMVSLRSQPHLSHPPSARKSTLQPQKGFQILLEISPLLAIIGIDVAICSLYMLMPNVVNVSKSSKGETCVISDEASNKKRLGGIIFNSTAEELQHIESIFHVNYYFHLFILFLFATYCLKCLMFYFSLI